MIKSIENLVSFPVNAQRNSFFGALSSILLYRDAYTEDTPFFCGKHQRSCIILISNQDIDNREKI